MSRWDDHPRALRSETVDLGFAGGSAGAEIQELRRDPSGLLRPLFRDVRGTEEVQELVSQSRLARG